MKRGPRIATVFQTLSPKECVRMKKATVMILVFALCVLTLLGCSPKNVEEYSQDRTITYFVSDYEAVYLDFEDGVLTVDLNVYKEDPSSPSGKTKDFTASESYTFSYVLEGDNYIFVADEKYYYTIDKDGLHFSVKFLGLAKDWQ